MRVLAALCIVLTFSVQTIMAQSDYNNSWKEVEQLVTKGLTSSALKKTDEIYQQAKAAKNEQQVIKALVYQLRFASAIKDSSLEFGMGRLNSEIKSANGPAKAILQSMKAEVMWTYLRQNAYMIRNRTDVKEDKSLDIRTWSANKLHDTITAEYAASLAQPELLQQQKLSAWPVVIDQGSNTTGLIPTLYDLLANRAINYYKSGINDLNKPANQFELTDPAAFAPAATYVAHTFTTSDDASLQFKALQLFQDLIRFHLNDEDKSALANVDVSRIQYVNQISVASDKKQLYEQALQQMYETYKSNPESGEVAVLLVQSRIADINMYDYTQSAIPGNKARLQAALTLCDQVIKVFPKSPGAADAYNLKQSILQKTLGLTVEKVNVPGQALRILTKYRNLNKVYLRLLSVPEEVTKKDGAFQPYQDKTKQAIRQLMTTNTVRTWSQDLPAGDDHMSHMVELKVDALQSGLYVLLISDNEQFPMEDAITAGHLFTVSNIAFMSSDSLVYALNRTTGEPLPNATVELWTIPSGQSKTPSKLAFTGKTDNNGKINIRYKVKDAADKWMKWTYKQDVLLLPNYYNYAFQISDYQHEVYPEKAPTPEVFFFTDRGLYRPGQTLYFKGIVLQKEKNTNDAHVVTDFKTAVQLHDANGELVDSVEVSANEFGAFSGKLTVPTGRITGVYSLLSTHNEGRSYFNVEEYKRPKFEVTFEDIKQVYRVGDTVTANGKAIAFAGNNIDNAAVTYRVVRRTHFPYPWIRSWKPMNISSREISNGKTTTDANGKFSIQFPAIPDRSADTAVMPYFTYEVIVDVTDINGETRSGTQSINAGYKSIVATVDIPSSTTATALNKIKVATNNLNGQFEPASLHLQLLPIQPEKRLMRARYWNTPDQFVYSKEEYVKLFPLDVYKNEDELDAWPTLPAVYDQKLQSSKDGVIQPGFPKLKPGYYRLEVTATPGDSQTVVQKATFQVVDENNPAMDYPQYAWVYTPEKDYEIGQTASVKLATAKDAYVLEEMMRPESETEISTFHLKGETNRQYKITGKDANSVQYRYSWVRDNRFCSTSVAFHISTEDKDLKIELAAHRNKLLPGEKEKWSVHISGKKADKVSASFLAAMYDASLDAIHPFRWSLPGYTISDFVKQGLAMNDNSGVEEGVVYGNYNLDHKFVQQQYPGINWYGWDLVLEGRSRRILIRGMASPAAAGAPAPAPVMRKAKADDAADVMHEAAMSNVKWEEQSATAAETQSGETVPVKARTNFNETAFFYPDLRTDKDGNVSFEFTMPEALTKWKFQGLAHTQQAAFGLKTEEIVTQKTLMVQPFAPRFMREGDKMNFTAKISNLADSQLIGQARLELLDANTMQPVDGWFQNIFPVQHFTAKAGQSTQVSFPIQIPNGYGSTLIYRITAQAGNFSDGEENAIPVLTNRMLVTESMTIAMQGDGRKSMNFKKLEESASSQTLQQHALTVEYTANPAWYAVQALPYLMEFPHDCAEQVFNRYYANTLAAWIVKQQPAIAQIFEKWKTADTSALMSNLEKNEDLKSVLLQQTPWVLDAKNENAQRHRIATLFDAATVTTAGDKALQQLAGKQSDNGAFPWFTGMWEDRYITQYIVAGIGRLNQLTHSTNSQTSAIADKAIEYLDGRVVEEYQRSLKQKEKLGLGGLDIQYLYARSFFDKPKSAALTTAWNYYVGLAKKDWTKFGLYEKAMTALLLNRLNDKVTATAILKSLKENAIVSPEMGMYWKNNTGGYYWNQAMVETQSLLIEVFSTVGNDKKAVGEMKTWLLKNKQTNNWSTTKATADGCYAMLIGGDNWLAATPDVNIALGSTEIHAAEEKAEAGTGYLRKQYEAKAVKPEMGKITVEVKGSKGQPSWGAVYWQYFEQLDKITAAATPLSIEKQLYKEVNSDKGPVLTQLSDGNQLKVGDKLKVRIVLRSDRNMEYIHLKDMRAAAFEPVNVLSTAKWQDGLSYYESTKDASTDFFFSNLPKGTWVFEYPMFVTHEGTFSNGVATAQCMYAPEFSAHSEGITVKVTE
ncbi:MAG: alpha-2-macroglobulin [Chitinophaga sp.]|uniref:alpha-2-macroglobulin family protein n=1 Tax=Chitinophaga sp. TaxID=1869181 RepID=UPI0025C0482A|nr:alpha-2-macroglobulin family protein [Chitinophaga sp.]MBV8254237.1 alpha-2-macroglobulin [Chitinophaga sp.]